jgi:hypothetical protein
MKSIQNQYNQLLEGNLSQANFMRAVRMTFPQYVTNVTSFNDSVKILKNKGILSEAKEYQCNPVELAMGIKVEMEHTDDPKKAEKIAMDHLKENPSYYSQLKLSGIDSHQELPKEKSKTPKAPKKGELVDKENGMKVVKENLDTNKIYGGTGQNQGDTGSSIQFTVTEDTPEYFEIDFTLTPNSRYRQAGAGSRSPREKEYGYVKVSKADFNGWIQAKGENFYIGKDFIANNLQEARLNMFPGEESNDTVKQAAQFIEMNNTLKPYSDKFILQNIGTSNDRAVLRYGYWEKLPSTLLEKFKLQFNVEEDVEEHDDRLPTTAYILTPLRPIGKVDVGAAFEKFKATLEGIVREVLEEENSK